MPGYSAARCFVIFRVPLKTALKRENEIGVSDTRKGSESGLAPSEET